MKVWLCMAILVVGLLVREPTVRYLLAIVGSIGILVAIALHFSHKDSL